MLPNRPTCVAVAEADDEVFDQQIVPVPAPSVIGRVLPPTSSTYSYARRVSRLTGFDLVLDMQFYTALCHLPYCCQLLQSAMFDNGCVLSPEFIITAV